MPKTGGTFTGDVSFRSGASSLMTWDTSANQLKFNDGVKAVFGAGQSLTDADLEIFHAVMKAILETQAAELFVYRQTGQVYT